MLRWFTCGKHFFTMLMACRNTKKFVVFHIIACLSCHLRLKIVAVWKLLTYLWFTGLKTILHLFKRKKFEVVALIILCWEPHNIDSKYQSKSYCQGGNGNHAKYFVMDKPCRLLPLTAEALPILSKNRTEERRTNFEEVQQ